MYAYTGSADSWPTTQSVEYPAATASTGYEEFVAAATPATDIIGISPVSTEPFYKSAVFWGNVVAFGALILLSKYVSKAVAG